MDAVTEQDRVVLDSRVDTGRLFAVVTDWPRHGHYVPFTRMTVSGPSGTGQELDAVTGLGRLRFHDLMTVTEYAPPPGPDAPGRAALRKHGRVLRGWAEIEVVGRPGGGSRLIWTEQISPALPAVLARGLRVPARVATRWMTTRLGEGLIREAEDD